MSPRNSDTGVGKKIKSPELGHSPISQLPINCSVYCNAMYVVGRGRLYLTGGESGEDLDTSLFSLLTEPFDIVAE